MASIRGSNMGPSVLVQRGAGVSSTAANIPSGTRRPWRQGRVGEQIGLGESSSSGGLPSVVPGSLLGWSPLLVAVGARQLRRRGARNRTRRQFFQNGGGTVGGEPDRPFKGAGRTYFNITGFPFPLGPLFSRRTVRMEVGDGIWVFEQEQTLANVTVNVRMTAIKLSCGGLWIHNPIAPTGECEALVRDLGLPVRYIVLGTVQYEHKIFVGPFSRRFPDAKVYVVPEQWSFPIDLPSPLYGIFASGELKDSDETTPWAEEIDQRLLCPKERLGFGYSAAECAFFHKPSKTLICTDALVYVPEEAPAVLDREELSSLGQPKNVVIDIVGATDWRGAGELVRERQSDASLGAADALRVGWQRNALLALFFGPDGESILDPAPAFNAIAGRWIVGPVCYSLVYSGKIRKEVIDWSNRLCEWDIEQIIPCHFAGPIRGSRDDVRRAFRVLSEHKDGDSEFNLPWPFPQPIQYRDNDLKLLTDIRNLLRQLSVI